MTKEQAEIMKLIPNAVPAPDWQAQGKKWEPQLHVTALGPSKDKKGWRATVETLKAFGQHAVACYFYYPFGPGQSFSLEVVFEPDEIGDDAVQMWNRMVQLK